ncbi:MAG: hypothetical protein LBS84_08645 [Clostridiales bacterium]|jgi:medium-chain acyl-[acyl-carrier-protein] hydrolase|nr:hypothetical protein [Clostridiales bacterium]
MEKFQTLYSVDYQSLNPDLTVTFPRLMYYVQETSIRHTESTSRPMRWYMENRRGWLVTNWSIRLSEYPKLMDNIIVKTYPIHFKGAIGERGFEAFKESGEPLLAAHSTWVFADLVNNKPVRPPIELLDEYRPEFPAPTEKKMGFQSLAAEDSPYYLASRRELTATRRDIDTNEHVNNIKYIEWAFDDIPEDVYRASRAREIKITYRNQCRAGDAVLAELYRHSGDPQSFVSILKHADGDQAVFAEVYALWDKNLIGGGSI